MNHALWVDKSNVHPIRLLLILAAREHNGRYENALKRMFARECVPVRSTFRKRRN